LNRLCRKSFSDLARKTARRPRQLFRFEKEAEDKFTVRATWLDGALEEMSGFTSEEDPDDRITNKFPIWVEEQEKARWPVK
jgi:hypothetical protein